MAGHIMDMASRYVLEEMDSGSFCHTSGIHLFLFTLIQPVG